MTELRLKSVFVKVIVPYIIALLCAGFACTQVVFLTIINCLSSLSMKPTFPHQYITRLCFLVPGHP